MKRMRGKGGSRRRALSLALAVLIAWSTLPAQAAGGAEKEAAACTAAVEVETAAVEAETAAAATEEETSDEDAESETSSGSAGAETEVTGIGSATGLADRAVSSEAADAGSSAGASELTGESAVEAIDTEASGEAESVDEDEAGDRLQSLQAQIDALPSPAVYDYLSISGKEEAAEQAAELKAEYYEELTDEEREQIDPANMFALDLYAHTLAYYPTEEEYDGQLSCEDVDTVRLTSGELEELQEDIDELPELEEVADVSVLEEAADVSDPEEGVDTAESEEAVNVSEAEEVMGASESADAADVSGSEDVADAVDTEEDVDLPETDDTASLAYTDSDTEVYLSSAEIDDLYEDVYDLSEDYYNLPASQASQVEEIGLSNLTAFFTVGVSLYASGSSGGIGTIDAYSYQRYSGNLADSEMHFGYYSVNTDSSGGSRLAFCMDSKLYSPGRAGTTLVSEESYTDKVVRTILYYGYGGPGERVSHNLNGYCETHMAVCYAVDKDAINKTFGKAAYKKLYTDVPDKTVYKYVKAAIVKGSVSGRQPLVYAIFSGEGKLKKVSSTDSTKVIAGAEYTVYTDSKCRKAAVDVDGDACVFTTTASGSNVIFMEPGIYYVKETKAAAGYALNTEVKKLTVKAGAATTLKVSDVPLGKVRAAKKGRQSGLFLEGAVYRVYADKECKTLLPDVNGEYELTTLTASPFSNTLTYPVGTVIYVKEYQAPAGMKLDSMAYCSTVEEGVTNWANGAKIRGGSFYDDEISKVRIRLQKSALEDAGSSDVSTEKSASESTDLEEEDDSVNSGDTLSSDMTNDTAAQDTASQAGAIFAMEYRNNVDGSEAGEADAVWYFRTDERGIIDFADPECLVEEYTFGETQSQTDYAGQTIRSDAVTVDDDGSLLWKAGTYRVKEISPPALYRLDGVMMIDGSSGITSEDDTASSESGLSEGGYTASVTEGVRFVITWDEETGEFVCLSEGTALDAADIRIFAYDRVHLNVLTVTKYGKNQAPLAGVTYQLTDASDGKICGTVTTGSDGRGSFTDLKPGDYVLTETETVNGYELLAENVTVHLPCQMTAEEVQEEQADIGKSYFDEVTQTYCFDEVTYDITDSVSFDMPLTGGSSRTWIATALAAVLLILGGWLGWRRSRR